MRFSSCSSSQWLRFAAICIVFFACFDPTKNATGQPRSPSDLAGTLSPSVSPPWLNEARKLGGVIVTIDRVDPEIIWQHQDVTLSYTITNFGPTPIAGQLEALLDASPLASSKSLNVQIPAGASSTDRIVLPAHSASSAATLRLTFDSRSDCIRVPWNNGAIRELCRKTIHEEDSRQIAVIEFIDILTSTDAPGVLPPPLPKACGSGLYPLNKIEETRLVPNPGAPYEWAEAPGAPAVPVLGRVINTNKNKKKDDIPWDHPFGFDFWFNVAPDTAYLLLLNVPGLASVADCPVEGRLPVEGLPLPAACEQADKGVRPGHDADACESFCIERANGHTPVGSLHTEIEERLIPSPYLPDDNDRVYMRGHHIVDCGHENFTAEIHPPTLIAKARSEPTTGGVQSTLIAAPFFTTQRYKDTTNPARNRPQVFWDQLKALIALNAFGPQTSCLADLCR